jgi:hypothetical protein
MDKKKIKLIEIKGADIKSNWKEDILIKETSQKLIVKTIILEVFFKNF